MPSEIAHEYSNGTRDEVDQRILLRVLGPSRDHSDVSGYGNERRGEHRQAVAGMGVAELEAPGIGPYVRAILYAAILQCAHNSEYLAEAARNRERIRLLQANEARQEAIRQAILNRKKKGAAAA